MEHKANKIHLRVRALCEGAIMIALALILSLIKLFPNLPNGGSITFAMFPICLYAVRWGLGRGLLSGLVFGLLQLIFDGAYAWGWQSMLLDYLVAFTPLGIAGLFKGKFYPATVVACVLRFLVHYVVGATIWAAYMPEEFFGMSMTTPWFYSLLYNLAYMLPNIVITLVVFAVAYKPLKKYFTADDLK